MRLERDGGRGDGSHEKEGWEILLKSGSIYVQRSVATRSETVFMETDRDSRSISDAIRYGYKHSILPYTSEIISNDKALDEGHRISLMIRVSRAHLY